MPRNLTDLMESAVASPPPEPHQAYDITRLAERRQRRRTTFVAGAAALVVVAAAGGAVALRGGGHGTTPEPARQLELDQTVDVSSAVSADSMPGYRQEPWTIPSVQNLGKGYKPLPTYRQIDSEGRLIVEDAPGGDPQGPLRVRIFDGPGQAPRAVQVPPDAGSNSGNPLTWIPSFQSDGRLLWFRSAPYLSTAAVGIHLTDLDGGNDTFVHTHYQLTENGSTDIEQPWVWGDRLWFTAYDSVTPEGGISYSLYSAGFSGSLTKVADHVAVAGAGGGTIVWMTTDGQVMTESAAGGPQRRLTVPLDNGCRMLSTTQLRGLPGSLAVDGSVIAIPESCGTGDHELQELLAFDTSGRRLVHVTGLTAIRPSLGGDSLVFEGLEPGHQDLEAFRYDLVTGTFARLDPGGNPVPDQAPQAAGRFVLWYDAQGGHVGEFTG